MYIQGIALEIKKKKSCNPWEIYFAKEECKFGREKQNQEDVDSCLKRIIGGNLILPLEADPSNEMNNGENNFPLKTLPWDSFQAAEGWLHTCVDKFINQGPADK